MSPTRKQGNAAGLALLRTLEPWIPPPAPPHPPLPYGGSGRTRALPAYRWPLGQTTPGPEAITDAQRAAWVAVHPFVRGGLQERTQRALAYIDTFARKR
jgi:hypothetical protein